MVVKDFTRENIGYHLKKVFRVVFKREFVRDWMIWGTYGKSGHEPLKWVILKNMSDEHIQAILITQYQINSFYSKEFKRELKFRKKNPSFSIKEAS